MWSGIFLFVVANLFSVALGAAMEPWIRRRVFDPLSYRLTRRRLRRSQGRIDGEFLSTNDTGGVYVHTFVPAGIPVDHLRTSIRETPHDRDPRLIRTRELLGIEPGELMSVIEDRRREYADWNSTLLALRSIDESRLGERELPTLDMVLEPVDYAAHAVVLEMWRDTITRDPDRLDHLRDPRQVEPLLSNIFGIDLTVETADGRMMLTRRGDTVKSYRGMRHVAVSEGLTVKDETPDRRLDLHAAAGRALHEELGLQLDPGQLRESCTFHTLCWSSDIYNWGLLGHVDLRPSGISAEELMALRRRGLAKDRVESSTVFFVDFDAASLDGALREGDWVPHGQVGVVLSARHRALRGAERLLDLLEVH